MAAKKKADAAVENTAEVTQETTEQLKDTVEQMTEDNNKELDNKKFVVDRLLSTKREGMEDLIDYMQQIGFFEAPLQWWKSSCLSVRTCSPQQKCNDGSRKYWLCTSWQSQVCRNS